MPRIIMTVAKGLINKPRLTFRPKLCSLLKFRQYYRQAHQLRRSASQIQLRSLRRFYMIFIIRDHPYLRVPRLWPRLPRALQLKIVDQRIARSLERKIAKSLVSPIFNEMVTYALKPVNDYFEQMMVKKRSLATGEYYKRFHDK
jgi:hypothetical protein